MKFLKSSLILIFIILHVGCGSDDGGGSSSGEAKQIADRIDAISTDSGSEGSSSSSRSISVPKTNRAYDDVGTPYSYFNDQNATYNITLDYFTQVNEQIETINTYLKEAFKKNLVNKGKQDMFGNDGAFYEVKEITDSNESNSSYHTLTMYFKVTPEQHLLQNVNEDRAYIYHVKIDEFSSESNKYGVFEVSIGWLLPYDSNGQVDYSETQGKGMYIKVSQTDDNKTKVQTNSNFTTTNGNSNFQFIQNSILVFDDNGTGDYKEDFLFNDSNMSRYAAFNKKYINNKYTSFYEGGNTTTESLYDMTVFEAESFASYYLFDSSSGDMKDNITGDFTYTHTKENEYLDENSSAIDVTFQGEALNGLVSFQYQQVGNKSIVPNVKNGVEVTVNGNNYVLAAVTRYIKNKKFTDTQRQAILDDNTTSALVRDINTSFAEFNYVGDFNATDKQLQP